MRNFLAGEEVLPHLKLHKKYLNSCEGKEFARRKLLFKGFSESSFKLLKSLYCILIFISLLGKKRLEGNVVRV